MHKQLSRGPQSVENCAKGMMGLVEEAASPNGLEVRPKFQKFKLRNAVIAYYDFVRLLC